MMDYPYPMAEDSISNINPFYDGRRDDDDDEDRDFYEVEDDEYFDEMYNDDLRHGLI